MEPSPRIPLIPVAAWLARAVVGLAFVVAGTTKIVHPATFIADIWSYRLIPEAWAYWVAAFLPWLELVVGAALITSRQRRGARLIAAALLLAFLIAIVVSWARGLDIACGCFGGASAGEATNYPWLVTRDLLLIACLGIDWMADRWLLRSGSKP
jgi:uncharacterized membrane protein YphA (DoxX/SURF4 family)